MSAKTAGAGERMVTLDVSLLGRDYKVACKDGEQAELRMPSRSSSGGCARSATAASRAPSSASR